VQTQGESHEYRRGTVSEEERVRGEGWGLEMLIGVNMIKYSICTCENVTAKPIVLHNGYKLLKLTKIT
jgi:hypothetical protein